METSFVEYLGQRGLFLVTIVPAISLYMAFTFWLLKKMRLRRERRKTEFMGALEGGLTSGAIASIEDVLNIYRGVTNLSDEDAQANSGLNKWLRELLVRIVSGKIGKETEGVTLLEWKAAITGFLKSLEETSPYSDLPDLERSILGDIGAYLSRDDHDSAVRKLKELASAIQARNNILNRMRTSLKLSSALAIIGFLLTATFGIMNFLRF